MTDLHQEPSSGIGGEGIVLSGTGGVWRVRRPDGSVIEASLRGRVKKSNAGRRADGSLRRDTVASAAESLKLASELRGQGLRVTVYPEADKFGKQMKYADSIRVPYVCVLGESEIAENKVTLKNMDTGDQQTVSRVDLASKVPK